MGHVHQFLKLLFGGIGGLMHLVLQSLDRLVQGTDAFFDLYHGPAHVFDAFILRKRITRPTLLVIGFECDPFLAQAVFSQALHFGHFVDAPFQFGVEFVISFLGLPGRAQGFLKCLGLGFENFYLLLEFVRYISR